MIAFVHVAKTAGKTVDLLLRSSFGLRHLSTPDVLIKRSAGTLAASGHIIPKYGPEDLRLLLRCAPRPRSLGGHHIAMWSGLEQVVPDIRYLVFLREPIARAASHYQFHLNSDDMTDYLGREKLGWQEWLDWEVPHNHQLKMLSRTGDPDEALRALQQPNVFVGLVERFDESLLIFKRLFCPDLNIAYRRQNVAPVTDVKMDLLGDPAKRDQLEALNRAELPVFAYVRDELFERYVAAYGPGLAEDLAAFRASGWGRINQANVFLNKGYRRFILPRVVGQRVKQRQSGTL